MMHAKRAARMVLCLILFILVLCVCTGCQKPSRINSRPSVDEVDLLFESNYDTFHRVARMLCERPGFHNWYYQKFGWHDIMASNLFGFRNEQNERKAFVSDEEWLLIEKLFTSFQLTGIHMNGDNFPIEFCWRTRERGRDGDLVDVSYVYSPNQRNYTSNMPFTITDRTDYEKWYRTITY